MIGTAKPSGGTSVKPDLIERYYDLQVSALQLMDKHFETEIYTAETTCGKFLVKVMPLFYQNVDSEGMIAGHLWQHGLKVARFLRNKEGNYVTKCEENQFTLQEFVEGKTLALNSAPEWFLEKAADYLGKTTVALKEYGSLPMPFDKAFFAPDNALQKRQQYLDEQKSAEAGLIPVYEEQIRHLERIAQFHIDTERLTYANSHGDFHIGQAIVQDQDITVVDWASACCLPICLDIATCYAFASPRCSEGALDAEGLCRFIRTYTKHVPLMLYDIQALPYVMYFWYCICNYSPTELASISASDRLVQNYQPIAVLIQKLLQWLSVHVEELSEELVKEFQQ